MAQRIFITATNTDIGKTYATKLLIASYSRMGYRVGVIKPIETGVDTRPPDGTELFEMARSFNPELEMLDINDIVPIQFQLPAAPYVANRGRPLDLKLLHTAIKKVEPLCDILLIEGAGGLLVPIDPDNMIIDLIQQLDAHALLITHSRLGCINDTLLNLAMLDNHHIRYSWAINCRDNQDDFSRVSEPYFLDRFGSFFELTRDIDKVAKSLLNL